MKSQSAGKTSKPGRQLSSETPVIEGGSSDPGALQQLGPEDNAPLLHTSPASRLLLSRTNERLRRAGTEPAADRLFSELGSAAGRYLKALSEVGGYHFLSDYGAGVTLDRKHLAITISTPVKALLANPFHELHGKSPESRKVTRRILDAITHEAVKAKLGSTITDDKFGQELRRLGDALHRNGAYERIFDEMKTGLGHRWETYRTAQAIYTDIGQHERVGTKSLTRAERQAIEAARIKKGKEISLARYYAWKSQRDAQRKSAAAEKTAESNNERDRGM